MPNFLNQPSANIIGANVQEWHNQTQLMARPHLKLAIGFGTADATALYTLPTLTNGAKAVRIDSLYWEIGTSFTGGASSTIGISSTNTRYNVKGDLLGGSAGDVAATLVSTQVYVPGTLGAKFAVAATTGKVILVAGDSIRFDVITSAFTAGAGFVHIDCSFLD